MNEDDAAAREKEKRFLRSGEMDAVDNMSTYLRIAENTDNSVFIWKAMSEWVDANNFRRKLGSELLSMPKQILHYLETSSRSIRDLSEGIDFRQAPEPFGYLPRTMESVEIAHRRLRTLEPPQATKLALHALGFKRVGWNGFERAKELDWKFEDELSYKVFREVGEMGDNAAVELLLEDFSTQKPSRGSGRRKVEDARGLRKRIKAAREARRPKT